MAVQTAAQKKAYDDQIMAGWNAAKAAEKAGGNTQAQMMAGNSAEYKYATPEVQQQLHQQNLDIAKKTGQTYNPASGTYSAPVSTNPTTVAAPKTQIGTAVSTNTPSNKQPSAMAQAMQALPSYIPPASTGINFDQAKTQVSGQLDPMFQRALEDLQKQKYQDQLNGDQLGMARGGSHSGLAADLQNKVGIAAAGKASDLDATRQTQIAEMAQALVNRGEDNDFRNKQAALAEYLGINGLNLQAQGQNFNQGIQEGGLTGIYKGMQTLAGQQQSYNQSPNNPQNQGQVLQNQGQAQQNLLNQYKIDDYPAEQRAAAEKIKRETELGNIDVATAKYNFEQLKDPNSTYNQAAKIDLQLKQLDLKNAPQKAQLEIEQLQRNIAEIGKVHYKPQTAAEIAQDKVTLATANKQLADIANGFYPGDNDAPPAKTITAEEYQKNLKPQINDKGQVTNLQQLEDQIILSGMSDWEQYKAYIANNIPWTDPIPQRTTN